MYIRYTFYNYITYFNYKHENVCFMTCGIYLKESNGNAKYYTLIKVKYRTV